MYTQVISWDLFSVLMRNKFLLVVIEHINFVEIQLILIQNIGTGLSEVVSVSNSSNVLANKGT